MLLKSLVLIQALFHDEARSWKAVLGGQELWSTEQVLKDLHAMCKLPNGTEDGAKAEWLLEMYALEVQMCSQQGDTSRLKSIHEQTIGLSHAIKDPNTMAIIHEAGGKMYMTERDWANAFSEFFKGFQCYQETADQRARECLKYVVLANLLSQSDINPFDSREAKAYEDYPEIRAMTNLRRAQ